MTVVTGVTCPVCGTFCDDIEVVVKDNVITDVRNACAMGAAKFLSYATHRGLKPLIRKNGELVEASMDEAVTKAAEILADATYPILYGWSSTSCEAVRVGLELAEEVGGVIDNTSTVCHGPSILSIHDIGNFFKDLYRYSRNLVDVQFFISYKHTKGLQKLVILVWLDLDEIVSCLSGASFTNVHNNHFPFLLEHAVG